MKMRAVLAVVGMLMAVGVLAKHPWQTATTINGATKPFSAGLDAPVREAALGGGLIRGGMTSEVVGNVRYFDVVIAYKGRLNGKNPCRGKIPLALPDG